MAATREPRNENRIPPIPRLCRYLSELSPLPMVAVDGATHVVSYANPAFARMAGKRVDQITGRPFAEAVPEGAENDCLATLDRVFRTGRAENLAEQEHLQLQPRPVYWSYAMWPIFGEEKDRPVGVMIQITDVTETALYRQQSVTMNEALLISATRQNELTEVAESLSKKLAAAVSARDHFLAVLSHELRNPLAAINSGLKLLNLSAEDRVAADAAREMMERQMKQMIRLVDDLLDVSRITTGKLDLQKERVELASVVCDAVEASRELIEASGHELTVTLPLDPVFLDADPVRLTQVFLNLLQNAAKYSEPSESIQLTAHLDGREVEVSVKDHGIGIPAAELPHIFETFVQVDTSWQRMQGGMGIGLALVKQFVELHHGRVEARSAGLGHGSEFIVRLPLAAEGAPEQSGVEKIPPAPCKRILVVDDNRDAAEMLSMLLTKMGHEARTAYGGDTVVSVASEFRPTLVLMDIGMPNVDGYEAARRIRAQAWGKDILLVALTGWGAEADRRQTHDAGFDCHLVKPVNFDALTQLIAQAPNRSP